METVLQYEIPVYHPMAVHFPVALILVAARIGKARLIDNLLLE